jgi:predicted CXXCH cytochrome family protein
MSARRIVRAARCGHPARLPRIGVLAARVPAVWRPRAIGLLGLAAGVGIVLAGGCSEDKECTACPSPSVRLDSISTIPKMVSVGESLHVFGYGEGSGLTFRWSATHGRFIVTDENYARWKAPDDPVVVTITLVAYNQTESATTSLIVPVGIYVPRNTPAYAGASYCGLECHDVSSHGQRYDSWVTTTHAQAFKNVETSAAYGDSCLSCHTVGAGDTNDQGWALHNGGFDEAPVARLAGVQCESCHGPLADAHGDTIAAHGAAAMGDFLLEVGTAVVPVGCGRCHEAEVHDHNLVSEWSGSRHAFADQAAEVSGDPQCAPCHTAQGFIESMQTGGAPVAAPANPVAVTCAACHDPHANTHAGDLRVGYERDDDLCRRCHSDAGHAPLTAPHTPQAQMLAGEGGYEYDLADPPSSPHINIVEKGCVQCHYPDGSSQPGHRFRHDNASCVACHPDANPNSLAWSHERTNVITLLTQLQGELEQATEADSATEGFQRANYNLKFVRADRSNGVHNYKYAKALLEKSIADFEPTR